MLLRVGLIFLLASSAVQGFHLPVRGGNFFLRRVGLSVEYATGDSGATKIVAGGPTPDLKLSDVVEGGMRLEYPAHFEGEVQLEELEAVRH